MLDTAPDARSADATPPTPGARKILVVCSFARLAGAQIAAIRVAAGLAARGHAVKLAFLYEIEPLETPGGYALMHPGARPGAADYLRIVWRTLATVRRERPDAVISFLPLASVLAQTAAALAGVRSRVVSYRTTLDSAFAIPRWLDVACAWTGVYTGAIFVAEAVRRTARRHPRGFLARSRVVHNGLWDFAPSTLGRVEARRRFDLPPDAFVLVAIGRLAPQKNPATLVRTVAALPGAVLAFAGEGPLRAEVESLAADLGVGDRVRLLGRLDRHEVPDVLAAADVLVQASLYEGQSNTVLEALAAGVPVVAHDIPEQREILVDPADGAACGVLVPVDDIAAWTSALRALRDDPEALDRARRSAAAGARRFDFERMIDGFEAAVRDR